jgi:hypothetical protein
VVEPVFEASGAELGVAVGDEGALAQLGAEVPSFRIGDHDTLIPHGAQRLSDEVLEPQRFGPADLMVLFSSAARLMLQTAAGTSSAAIG